jgi:hypothetical protein
MITIHGKQYITVAERIVAAHEALKSISITTEVLFQNPVVIKATVTTSKGVFTGISAANPNKTIEKMSPYEVAETSAVGRALGFAGYGVVEGVATADEMIKASTIGNDNQIVSSDTTGANLPKIYGDTVTISEEDLGVCSKCGSPNALSKVGNKYCSAKCWMN